MAEPYPTFDAFRSEHLETFMQLRDYLNDAKSNYQTVSHSLRQQMFSATGDAQLHACNVDARLRLVATSERLVEAALAHAREPLFLVTLTPNIFTRGLDEAAQFDVKELQRWVAKWVPGLDYVGIVEAGFYPRWPDGKPNISWHAHLIVWNVSYYGLNKLLSLIRANFETLVPGIEAAHTQRFKRDKIAGKLRYMLKFPMRKYLPFPMTRQEVDGDGVVSKVPTGRLGQNKPPMRPGELVRMCRVLEDKYLDRMIFGGGAGGQLAADVRRTALHPFQRSNSA